jgi:hypothetical protein
MLMSEATYIYAWCLDLCLYLAVLRAFCALRQVPREQLNKADTKTTAKEEEEGLQIDTAEEEDLTIENTTTEMKSTTPMGERSITTRASKEEEEDAEEEEEEEEEKTQESDRIKHNKTKGTNVN